MKRNVARVEAAAARAEAATPEPWWVRTEKETGELGSVLSTWIDAVEARVGDIVRWEDDYGNPHMPADATFMAAARSDVPWLCDELRNAWVVADELEAMLRQELWLKHAAVRKHHAALYGDDGELQCNKCLHDYRREPLVNIYVWAVEDGLAAIADPAP